jgi:hypothetical protein
VHSISNASVRDRNARSIVARRKCSLYFPDDARNAQSSVEERYVEMVLRFGNRANSYRHCYCRRQQIAGPTFRDLVCHYSLAWHDGGTVRRRGCSFLGADAGAGVQRAAGYAAGYTKLDDLGSIAPPRCLNVVVNAHISPHRFLTPDSDRRAALFEVEAGLQRAEGDFAGSLRWRRRSQSAGPFR